VTARITIPLPFTPVPITLQVLAVILTGLILGSRQAAAGQLLYLAAIAAGAPLSAAAIGGPAAFMTPTAGYLVAFVPAAFVAGRLSERRGPGQAGLITNMLAGMVAVGVVYLCGAGWLAVLTGDLYTAVVQGVLPFIGLDLAKAAIAAPVARGGRSLLFPQ
jgi:biotin transport system substrate-specific component